MRYRQAKATTTQGHAARLRNGRSHQLAAAEDVKGAELAFSSLALRLRSSRWYRPSFSSKNGKLASVNSTSAPN
jgi:hypothetical protein